MLHIHIICENIKKYDGDICTRSINISAAFGHRLLTFVLNKSLDKGLFSMVKNASYHMYLNNLRIHDY